MGRDRDRDRKRRRSRSRSRSRSPRVDRISRRGGRDLREKSRSPIDRDRKSKKRSKRDREKSPKPRPDSSEGVFSKKVIDKDEAQVELEKEMQRRRERIERWRAERREQDLKDEIIAKKEMLSMAGKKWTLDEEGEDDEEPMEVGKSDGDEDDDEEEDKKPDLAPLKRADEDEEDDKVKYKSIKKEKEETIVEPMTVVVEPKVEEEDEEDPLDAFMRGVKDEVNKITGSNNTMTGGVDSKGNKNNMVILKTGFAKKKVEKNKGELLEQNMDGLEYSSEEETEDLENTITNLAAKKKEVVKIDHGSINYLTFRKNFYVEIPEIKKMTNVEVDLFRAEMEGIKVKGKACPKPIKSWAQAGLSKKEMEILKKLKFEKPTPIQTQAIPAIMSGRDIIGIAKTGSGKTLAFLLPMFRHILDQPDLDESEGPISIVMAPTRELCMQIGKDAKRFCKSLNLRVVCVYGGTGISEQIAELKRGAEIIVCTPGRMIDMLAANSGRVTNLRRVTFIVLDEADRMFDLGFEPQVMRIVDNVRPDRQTVMFSATFPRQMEGLARKILNKPIEIQVGGRSFVCKEVDQHVVILEDDNKFLKLLELLGIYQEHGSAIVFVDTQENADNLLKDLLKSGYPCLSLHGGIDQSDRESTISDFKQRKIPLLVATSIAARGIDVKQLILVVNYDCPNHYEDYVHRCGRTGRAGNRGVAYTFITPDQERYAGDVIKALEQSEAEVPPELTKLWTDYKAKEEQDGKKVKSNTGFSGKGFKFDDTEAQLVQEKKKFQKHAFGLEDSDDEDLEGDIEQQIETMMAPKRTVKEVIGVIGINPNTSSSIPVTDKLELAKRLASKIQAEKNLGTDSKAQYTAEAIMKGNPLAPRPNITAKSVASVLAAKLNTRLNYQPDEAGSSNPDSGLPFSLESTNPPVQTKYEEELVINDFPQQARWRITSKETLAQIGDYSEAGITVRGTFVPTGKTPPEGERKLYLAIESMSEIAVSKAKKEICRILKEELLRISTSANHFMSGSKGRYKVL